MSFEIHERFALEDKIRVIMDNGCVYEGIVSWMCRDGSMFELIPDILSLDERIRILTDNVKSITVLSAENPIPADTNEDRMVSHPPHYRSKAGLEVIDVIEAFTDGLVGIEATNTGNIIKYICRWSHKNGLQDLEKAKWYLDHLIKHLKEKEND